MSHRALSHAEFAAQGGGSRRFADGTTANGGFYVSRHQREGGEDVHERHATAVDVAAHWSANRSKALASAPDAREVYQGLWEDHHASGTTSYLDVSDRVQSRRTAIKAGLENNQKAVYDANRGASVFLNQGRASVAAGPADPGIHSAEAHYSLERSKKSGKIEWN